MKIDQDLDGMSSSKKKLNIKPIIIGLVILIIIIIGFVLVVLPELNLEVTEKKQPVNLEKIPEQSCTYISSLEPSKKFAILANGNSTDSTVSLNGPKSEFIMFYQGSDKEFVKNPYQDTNNSTLLADWLKEQGVKGLVVGSVDNNFIYDVKQNGINCYKSTEVINFFIREVVPENYCTSLSKANPSGVIALTTNDETQEGLISLEDYNAPVIQIYDGNSLLKTVDNPVISGESIDSLMTILNDNNVSLLISGTPRKPLEEALNNNNIDCVNSTEVISYVVNQFE